MATVPKAFWNRASSGKKRGSESCPVFFRIATESLSVPSARARSGDAGRLAPNVPAPSARRGVP
jgi:hypothetical protein